MKNYSAIVCASVLALALGACGGGDAPVEEGTTLQPVDGEVVGDPSAVASGGVEPAPAKQTPFGTAALVTSPINGKVRSLPSLTPSASVESRINSTSSGKSDPFAGRVISVRPVPPEPGEVEASFPLAGRGTSPSSDLGNVLAGGGGSSVAGGTGSAGRSGTTTVARSGGSSSVSRGASTGSGRSTSTSRAASGGTSASGGSTSASSGSTSASGGSTSASGGGASTSAGSGSIGGGSLPDLAARPPIPDPALARAVEVTGVVLVGSNYQAIVKAPNEPTSRYVTAGQRLSGGRVLVKRIENQGSEPVVILEEDGVEVVRSIGAPAEGSAGGDATAMLPELLPAS